MNFFVRLTGCPGVNRTLTRAIKLCLCAFFPFQKKRLFTNCLKINYLIVLHSRSVTQDRGQELVLCVVWVRHQRSLLGTDIPHTISSGTNFQATL